MSGASRRRIIMDTGQAFLTLETTATIFMAGVLWTMQLLNYPLLALVGSNAFPRYEAAHNRRFALVVVPGVLAAAGGIGLLLSRPGQVPLWAPAGELAQIPRRRGWRPYSRHGPRDSDRTAYGPSDQRALFHAADVAMSTSDASIENRY
jgi:hypothetical protein